ncbi:MAG: class I tRNA ligase family protein [Acidimicrobiia bacterium]
MRYVTTPIYYVNDDPHIGTAYTTVTTDALARWHRLRGEETFFLTGTDEHGLKVQQTAEANGVSPQEWADRTVVRFQEAWNLLDISNDDFIRTTEPRHHAAVRELLQRCYDNGDIYLGHYEGLYSVADEAYVTPDEVPELERQGREVIQMREENYFFKLSGYEQPLLDWYESHPDFVQPTIRRNEALGFIKQGLRDFSISRTSIDWGIPIPWDDSHVTYVWFDALTNYLTAAGFATNEERFGRYWPAVHIIGKDILRFHCVYWPAMLMSAGVAPPANVFVHGFLLVGGEKMSKTALNQIAPDDLVADFGVDGYRYHFLRDPTFGHDSDFSYEGMVARYNADLANNLGNLVARVATLVESKCGGVGPASDPDSPLAAAASDVLAKATAAWERVAPSVALEETWKLIGAANAHLEAHEPWKMEPGPDLDGVMGDALEVLRIVAIMAYPAIPAACDAIWQRIGLTGSPGDLRLPDAAKWGQYPGGLPVVKGEALFPRIKA